MHLEYPGMTDHPQKSSSSASSLANINNWRRSDSFSRQKMKYSYFVVRMN